MGKSNNVENKKRTTKKGNKKKTFEKYGKNTARGLRIKQEQLEKNAAKRKAEGDHMWVKGQMEYSKTKGKYCGGAARSICKITCRDKKHGGK
tara:strand:+ start:5208 stop:5483 length:276 start_codon:yes stop_codon:yes gene_type:complete